MSSHHFLITSPSSPGVLSVSSNFPAGAKALIHDFLAHRFPSLPQAGNFWALWRIYWEIDWKMGIPAEIPYFWKLVFGKSNGNVGFSRKTCLITGECIIVYVYTSSTAQGGGGSFKNRKPIGKVGCCESGMAERIHWWIERWLMSPLFLSLSLTIYLPTYLSSFYLSIYLSISLSLSSVYLSSCLPVYLSIYLSVYLSTCLSVVQCHWV